MSSLGSRTFGGAVGSSRSGSPLGGLGRMTGQGSGRAPAQGHVAQGQPSYEVMDKKSSGQQDVVQARTISGQARTISGQKQTEDGSSSQQGSKKGRSVLGIGGISTRSFQESITSSTRLKNINTQFLSGLTGIMDEHEHEEEVDERSLNNAAGILGVDRHSTSNKAVPPSGGLPLLRYRVGRVLQSRCFELCMGMIIVANSVTIGLALSYELDGEDTSVVDILEDVWLVCYAVELGMRFVSGGLRCLLDHWVKFDFLLVLIGIVESVVRPEIQAHGHRQFGFLMTLRMLRLARLARAVRLVVKFQVLWMLVRGMLTSAGTMFFTFVLLTIIIYIASAIAVELITLNPLAESDPLFQSVVEEYFRNLPETMLTLAQFAILDQVADIYRPLVQRDPVLIVYFAAVILVIPIVLMNLVTAIIVSSALDQASADKEVAKIKEEAKKVRLVKQLKRIFVALDEDASGQVSRAEIANMEQADIDILQDATSIGDPIEVFNALNVDGEDSLSIDDFCTGIWKLATSKATIEVQRMEKQVSIMFSRVKHMEARHMLFAGALHKILHNQEYLQQSLAHIDASLRGEADVPRVAAAPPGVPDEPPPATAPAAPPPPAEPPSDPGPAPAAGPADSRDSEDLPPMDSGRLETPHATGPGPPWTRRPVLLLCNAVHLLREAPEADPVAQAGHRGA